MNYYNELEEAEEVSTTNFKP